MSKTIHTPTYASLLTPEARDKWYAEFLECYGEGSEAVYALASRLLGVDEEVIEDELTFDKHPVPVIRIPILSRERIAAIERLIEADGECGQYGEFETDEDEDEYREAEEGLEVTPAPNQWLVISAEDPPAWFMAEHFRAAHRYVLESFDLFDDDDDYQMLQKELHVPELRKKAFSTQPQP